MPAQPPTTSALPQRFTTLFNLNDPAEAFMAGWITRLHLNPPRLYQALDLKRSDSPAGRLIYELALWQGRPLCFLVIIWDIDEVSMRWQEFRLRRDATLRYRQLR